MPLRARDIPLLPFVFRSKHDSYDSCSDDEDDDRDEQLHFLSTMSKVKEQEFHRNMQVRHIHCNL